MLTCIVAQDSITFGQESDGFFFSLPDAQSVHDLLYMTPHVWRITKRGAEALAQTAQLTDTAEVIFNIYGRQEAGNLLE